ncbi:hypothetical protein K1T71_005575 [Dendrolimus kikuchii]|uniref:Uncharacterized protein n=1 Tax=Dendrolimus kikuchii TaxID=765133 RepID=A0ACC1D4K9_9NEOP|nr:hypothetical protein K1T71_005575 [Dendrolimus kikuchii]
MEISLRNTYNNCKKFSEKRLLKQVVTTKGRTGANGEVLGLKGPVRVTIKEKLENKKTKEEIEKFFIRVDVSMCTAGKRECKTKEKKKCQIRYTKEMLSGHYRKRARRRGFHLVTQIGIFYAKNRTTRNRLLSATNHGNENFEADVSSNMK